MYRMTVGYSVFCAGLHHESCTSTHRIGRQISRQRLPALSLSLVRSQRLRRGDTIRRQIPDNR